MDDGDRLRQRVARFPRWHYEFELGGVRTPIFNPGHVNRHAQRRDYFFAPLVQLAGGSLAGKRVLDLGCNAGFWSLAAIEAGAAFVLGVDGRQMHVDQAKLVFEANGVAPTRFRFMRADVFEMQLGDESFDVVLCLALLYHVSRPFELLDRIASWNDDLLVIDTTLDTSTRRACFRVAHQDLDDPRDAVDRPVALYPTGPAVTRLVEEFGYRCAALPPRFTSWQSALDYRDGRRRAYICAKRTSLDGLDSEPVGPYVGANALRVSARRRARTARRLVRSRLGRGRRGRPVA